MKNIYVIRTTFLDFIRESKLNSYAKDLSKKPPKIKGARKYIYKKGPFFYQDYYAGSFVDGGMEIVRYENNPIWMMGYQGGILNENPFITAQDIFVFLKKALRLCPKEMPLRGPRLFRQDGFLYKNSIYGSIANFSGKESILLADNIVYKKKYIGGILQGKLYRVFIQ